MIILEVFYNFVFYLTQILTFAIFIRALLSWFPLRPENPLVIIMHQITEPVLQPLRRVVPMIGMIDITPLVAILLLQLIGGMVPRL
ncbi:MAG: YggT family protein [Chloroflexi bacterium]|nr:YggT family protein [Chloroflexota bacterium]